MLELWKAIKPLTKFISITILALALIAAWQWGYIMGEKNKKS